MVACDLPFASAAVMRHLLQAAPQAGAVVPHSPRGPEPLLAVYARRLLPALRAALAAGVRRVGDFLAQTDVVAVSWAELAPLDPDGTCWMFWEDCLVEGTYGEGWTVDYGFDACPELGALVGTGSLPPC